MLYADFPIQTATFIYSVMVSNNLVIMDPPCHIVTKLILPNLKRELARDLYDSGLSQAEISRKLAVSQAMISKYLDGGGEPELPEELRSEVSILKNELAAQLEAGAPMHETVHTLCQGCFRIRERGVMCLVHSVENCNTCTRLRYGDLTEDKRTVVEDIKNALRNLESKDVSSLAPQVSMNIAQALREAETRMDVASIPGRISFVRGKPVAPLLPEFGASRHLSELLLSLEGDLYRAVINIKLDRGVEGAIGRTSLVPVTFNRKSNIDLFRFVKENGAGCDVILDHGDFGIEPCTYVLGKNAVDASRKVILIMGENNNGKRT